MNKRAERVLETQLGVLTKAGTLLTRKETEMTTAV